MTVTEPPGLRERARRAVLGELVEVAQGLFVERGFDGTTVEAIAAAAGMSRRTFFRYFASKEDLILGKYDLMGDRLVEALEARPADEPAWTALRRMFDGVVAYTTESARVPAIVEMERVVSATPGLRGAWLGRMAGAQERVAQVLARRDGAEDGPVVRALTGAAFACFIAARDAFLAAGRPFAEGLDEAMAAVRPRG